MLKRSFYAWIITFLFALIYPAITIPVLYFKLHNGGLLSIFQGVGGWAIGYLVGLCLLIFVSIYLSAARVTLYSKGYLDEVLTQAARDLAKLVSSNFGSMKGHIALIGGSLAGAGLTATLAYIVATASINSHTAPIWPYELFAALIVIGIVLYVIGIGNFKREVQKDNPTDKTDSGV